MSGRGVLVTGMGPVSVAGVNGEAFAARLRGSGGVAENSVGDLNLTATLTSAKTYLDRNSQLGLLAASLALGDAGLLPMPTELESVGVSFGTAWGNADTEEMFFTMLADKGPKLASPLLFIHSYPNTTSSLLAIEWGLKGRALNFCTGRSAGAEAVLAGLETVADGAAQVMLVGAAEAGKGSLGPMNEGADFREAAGMIILETEATAKAREAVVYARVSGWARGAAPTSRGDVKAVVEQARAQAGIQADQIGAVIVDADSVEGKRAAERATGGRPCVELAGFTGQTGSVGMVLGMIAGAQALEAGKLPAGLGGREVRKVMVVSRGVFDAAVVMERYE